MQVAQINRRSQPLHSHSVRPIGFLPISSLPSTLGTPNAFPAKPLYEFPPRAAIRMQVQPHNLSHRDLLHFMHVSSTAKSWGLWTALGFGSWTMDAWVFAEWALGTRPLAWALMVRLEDEGIFVVMNELHRSLWMTRSRRSLKSIIGKRGQLQGWIGARSIRGWL